MLYQQTPIDDSWGIDGIQKHRLELVMDHRLGGMGKKNSIDDVSLWSRSILFIEGFVKDRSGLWNRNSW